jgi:BirA family biotin operon repressor/biotin-[acetyl-CoA-carboxylase] ligase
LDSSLHIEHSQPKILQLKEVDSTNAELKRLLLKERLAHGTSLIADHQNTGKGQGGNQWYDEPAKSLLFSVYLNEPNLASNLTFDLNIAISLSVYDLLSHFISPDKLYIKWPNDIILNDQKVGGVLIENQWHGQNLIFSVCGVGINVFNDEFPEYLPLATSLCKHSTEKPELKKLAITLQHIILSLVNHLNDATHAQNLWRRYQNVLWRKGEIVTIETDKEMEIQGTLLGTDREGRLKVKTGGKEIAFIQGSIKLAY